MSKLDNLRRATGGNVAESMGKGVARTAPTHDASPSAALADRWAGTSRLIGAQVLPLDRIIRDPMQPRESFPEAELTELAESIRSRGVLQPIRARWDEALGMYVIIAGERRYRASRLAGLASVPCIVDDAPLTEAEVLLDQLAENLIRLDLEPIEQAKAFKRLMTSNGWSARRLAEALHIDHDKVNRAVRLLELPAEIQAAVAVGDLAPTTAFELTKLENSTIQAEVAAVALAGGLSRAAVAETVRQRTPKGKNSTKGARGGKAKILPPQIAMRSSSGHKITIEHRKGVDPIGAALALEEIAAKLRAEQGSSVEAA